MKWRKKISNSTLVLVVVLLLGFILRFYNTPRRYGFDYDATRDALIAIYGAQTLQLPLHGPPSALGSFHFGPWYYYQLILFQLLLPFQYAPWISVSLISLVGVFFMYKLGETIGDWKLGAILALLAAISPAQVIASTGLSNPDMVFASCTFVLWVFVKSIREKLSLWWAFWFGLMLGVGINYHFQMATFLLFPLFLLVFKKHQRISFFTTAFLGGIVSFLPLLLFNSNNNWHTVRGFFFYLREGKNAVYVPNSWTIYLHDFWPEFWANTIGVPVIMGLVIGVLCSLILLWLLITRKIELSMVLVITAFIIQFIYLRYYTGSRESYYILYMHPFIFTFVGYGIWKAFQVKKGIILGSSILIFMLFFIIPKSIAAGHVMESHTQYQGDISQLTNSYKGQKIAIFDCGRRDRHRSQAYAFLLHHKGLLGEKGARIGVFDESCYDTNIQKVIGASERTRESKTNELPVKNTIDLTPLSPEQLKKSGWMYITPQSVYERELR